MTFKREKQHTQKINEMKSWFLEKINKIEKPLTKITKETEKIHITNIRYYQYRL